MRKFRFKLEEVLKQRKRNEDAALAFLATAQRAFQAEKQRKAKLLSDLDLALNRREVLGQEAVGVIAFRTEQDFIVGTKQRIIQADQAILRASRSVEKALRGYLLSKRASRVIEILREKAFAEYKKEMMKKEQRELDDLIVMRSGLENEFKEASI